MTYEEFVKHVQEKARLQTYADAQEATDEVMHALAQVLPHDQVPDLCCDLPIKLRAMLREGPSTPDGLVDRDVFLGWLMNRVDTTGGLDRTLGGLDSEPDNAAEEVERRITAVLAVFKTQLSRNQRTQIAALLPQDLRRWFRAA